MAYMVGVTLGEWFKFDQNMAPYPADVILSCDKVCQQLSGNAYVLVLRKMDIEGTYCDIITQHFNTACYLDNNTEGLSISS